MDPAPPAWLRSYKAQSAIIPNFASQVRSEIDPQHPTTVPPERTLTEKEDQEKTKHAEPEATAANPFTFPSMISLTLHNVGSLDKFYSNSTPHSSPHKTSFDPQLDQHPAFRKTKPASPRDLSARDRRRGPLCRFLAAIRRVLVSKTQHKLAH
ncbi:MAG: hypothetical protein L6R40_000579 [Gallowayella cf. fulva]|nr:MAG: hypothetical protein L6R40_000579 [Xanthomendoza cf. fulva]